MCTLKYLPLTILLFLHPVSASEYKPLFSKKLLKQAQPEARARMQALDDENRRRWEAGENDEITPEPANPPSGKVVIYRYIDSNGKVQFSEKPVGEASVAIEMQNEAPTEQSLLEHAQNQRAQQQILDDFDERQKIRDRRASEVADAVAKRRQHDERCETLLIELRDYQRGGLAYYELDDAGNRRYLEDWEITEEINELKELYVRRCGEIAQQELK